MNVNNTRIAKNAIYMYIRMFLVMGISLYTSKIIFQNLGVENFGIYEIVGGVVTIFIYLSAGLGGATSRYLTFELGRKNFVRLRETFSVALLVHIFIGLIIVFLAETIGLWFLYEKLVIPADRISAALWVYQISILTAFITIVQVPYDSDIIAHEDMKIYAYLGMIEVILKLVVVLLLVYAPIDKLIFYSILLFAIRLLKMIFTQVYCIKKYEESHFSFSKNKSLYKELFVYAGSDLIGSVSSIAQGQGMNILLNLFFGPILNAARGISSQVHGAVFQFGNNFMTAVRPQIIKYYAEGDLNEMWRLVVQSSRLSFYMMLMICIPICLEANYILSIWLGDFPPHTVAFLILVIIFCLIQMIKIPRITIFHATGKILKENITAGIVLCFAFPLAYIFLKLGGEPECVFIASIISMLIAEIVSAFVLKSIIDFSVIQYFIKVHGTCFLVMGISFGISYILYDSIMPPSFVRLLTTCVISTISIGVCSLYIGMNSSMRNMVYSTIKKKFLKVNKE